MEITYDGYIQNPMGIKNSVISNREMYRGMYIDKLDKILVREVGKVNYFLYKDKNKFYVHMRIPSEVVDKFYYDTIIEFYTDKKELLSSRTLSDYYVKFYSNDPSFVFTFAHAFIKNKIFIEDLESKMSKQAIQKNADIKNPANQVGYVKSLYFAYLLMKQYGLFNKIQYETNAKPYNKKELLTHIEHADTKIQKRQEGEAEQKKKKRIEREKSKNTQNPIRNEKFSSPLATPSKKIGTVGSVVKTKTIEAIKKIKRY